MTHRPHSTARGRMTTAPGRRPVSGHPLPRGHCLPGDLCPCHALPPRSRLVSGAADSAAASSAALPRRTAWVSRRSARLRREDADLLRERRAGGCELSEVIGEGIRSLHSGLDAGQSDRRLL